MVRLSFLFFSVLAALTASAVEDQPFLSKSCTRSTLEGAKLVKLALWSCQHEKKASRRILIAGGLHSTIPQYDHVMSFFYTAGYDVFGYDHRGFGESERILVDSPLAFVDDFRDYVEDMNIVVQSVRAENTEMNMLTGSLGGLIALYYLQNFRHPFAKVSLIGPLWGLKDPTGALRLKLPVLRGTSWIADRFGFGANSPPGGGVYDRLTWHWIEEVSAALAHLEIRDRERLPAMVVLFGEADDMVEEADVNSICKVLREKCSFKMLSGRHNLLLDLDQDVRQKTLKASLEFFGGT